MHQTVSENNFRFPRFQIDKTTHFLLIKYHFAISFAYYT